MRRICVKVGWGLHNIDVSCLQCSPSVSLSWSHAQHWLATAYQSLSVPQIHSVLHSPSPLLEPRSLCPFLAGPSSIIGKLTIAQRGEATTWEPIIDFLESSPKCTRKTSLLRHLSLSRGGPWAIGLTKNREETKNQMRTHLDSHKGTYTFPPVVHAQSPVSSTEFITKFPGVLWSIPPPPLMWSSQKTVLNSHSLSCCLQAQSPRQYSWHLDNVEVKRTNPHVAKNTCVTLTPQKLTTNGLLQTGSLPVT